MLTKKYLELAERVSQSQPLSEYEALAMARIEDKDVMSLLAGAEFLIDASCQAYRKAREPTIAQIA